MTTQQAGRVVLEWWRADRPRNLTRLREISDHIARVHGLDVAEVSRAACAGVLAFEKADMLTLTAGR